MEGRNIAMLLQLLLLTATTMVMMSTTDGRGDAVADSYDNDDAFLKKYRNGMT